MASPSLSNQRNQRDRIISVLLQARGAWVCARELAEISLQYGARIYEGRHHLLLDIENKIEIAEDGRRLSWFRLRLGAGARAEEGTVRNPDSPPQQQELALTGEANVRYPG